MSLYLLYTMKTKAPIEDIYNFSDCDFKSREIMILVSKFLMSIKFNKSWNNSVCGYGIVNLLFGAAVIINFSPRQSLMSGLCALTYIRIYTWQNSFGTIVLRRNLDEIHKQILRF